MSLRYEVTACPLCRAEFDDPEDYRSHLAGEHDLVDDEGTETVLHESAPALPLLEAPPELDVLEPMPAPPPPPGPPGMPPPAPVTVAAVVRKAPAPFAVLAIAVAVQLLLGLVGVAIVGGDDSEEARSTVVVEGQSPTPAAAPVTTAPPDPAADKRRVDAALPHAVDFPAGWVIDEEAGSDTGSEDLDEEFDSCAARVATTEVETTAENDITFTKGANVVFTSVGTAHTVQAAVEGVDAVRAAMACIGEAVVTGIRSELPRGVTVTAGKFEPTSVARYGDFSDGQSMLVTVTGPGGQIGMRMDVFTMRKDRLMAMVLVATVNDEFTAANERSLLGVIGSRM